MRKLKQLLSFALVLCLSMTMTPAVSAATGNLEANEYFLENMDTLGVPYFITEENERNFGYAQELAAEIIGNQTNATAYEKAKTLFTWMIKNCEYDHERYNESQGLGVSALLEIADYYEKSNMYTNGYIGVCGDFAKMFAELCWAQNIPCVYVGGDYDSIPHAWNLFYADDKWHWVETTADSLSGFDMNINTMSTSYWATSTSCRQVASEWAKPWVLQAMEYGLIDHEFSKDITTKTPATIWMYFDEPCTRQGFAQLAVNLLEVYYDKDIDTIMTEKGVTPGSFTDTDNPDILAANALGIVNGSDGKYRPDDSITRQEAAAILYRTAKVMGYDAPGADLSVFEDLSNISSWAHDSVAFCKATGVMGGITDTTFSPQGEYTAEQCLVKSYEQIGALFGGQHGAFAGFGPTSKRKRQRTTKKHLEALPLNRRSS